MAIERIPCGGWDIDDTTFTFVKSGKKKVLTVIAGSQSDPSKLPLTGGTMLGPIELEGGAQPTESNHVVDKQYVDNVEEGLNQTIGSLDSEVNGMQTAVSGLQSDVSNIQSGISDLQDEIDSTIKKDGSTTTTTPIPFAQGIDLKNQKAVNMATPTATTDGATKGYVDNVLLGYLKTSGGAMTGQISMGSNTIINVANPANPQDVATKAYVDAKFAEALVAYRIRDLFGVGPRSEVTITLPDKRDNIAVVYYSVDPEGNSNIANSRAITVQAGQTVEGRDSLTVKFESDMVTFTIINGDSTNSILGQYYGYNTN